MSIHNPQKPSNFVLEIEKDCKHSVNHVANFVN